jgi:hypothetical protein
MMHVCFGSQVLYDNLKKNDYHIACAYLGEEFAFHAMAMKITVFDQVKCHLVASRLKDANLLNDHLNAFENYHVPPSSPLVWLSLVPNHEDCQESINKLKKSQKENVLLEKQTQQILLEHNNR